MRNKLLFIGMLSVFSGTGAFAQNSSTNFSATPDYSYDSYRARDTYSLNGDMSSSSLSKRNYYGSSSRTFSGNVLTPRSRSVGGNLNSGYTPASSGYSGSNYYGAQRNTNPAYHGTSPYKY